MGLLTRMRGETFRLLTEFAVQLTSSFAAAALAFPATSGAVAAASPGACNMLNVSRSAVGFDGMLQSGHGQGLENMIELVLASEAAGCTP